MTTKTETAERVSARNKAYYEAKKAGDPDFLAKRSAYKAAWRAKGNDKGRHRKWKKPLKSTLCLTARKRGRIAGLPATVRAADLDWPTHCPVLGIRLDYETPRGQRTTNAHDRPSLDRWDNSMGYVPDNVFVISLRANALKSNATADELDRVAHYARHGVTPVGKTGEGLTGTGES